MYNETACTPYSGSQTVDVMDGTDSVSPIITVDKITGGHRATIIPTCECDAKDGRAPLSELLRKLDDLSSENLDLTNLISDNLFGAKPEKGCDPTIPIGCMEDCIKSILDNVYRTNKLLIQIRERL